MWVIMKFSIIHLTLAGFGAEKWVFRQVSPDAATMSKFVRVSQTNRDTDWSQVERGESNMPDVTIVFWRDIPAQVIVGKGRGGAKRPLPERFEQAIDRAAMKIGARDSDDYLAEWRKAEPYLVEGEPMDVAISEAARLDAEYDQERLKALIANDGRA